MWARKQTGDHGVKGKECYSYTIFGGKVTPKGLADK